MPLRTDDASMHEACYRGDVEAVRHLLASGADPNARAEPRARTWISCAGSDPRPLNCVAIAHALGEGHLEIARLLIAHGAVVDDSVVTDHAVEMTLGPHDRAMRALLLASRSARAADG